MIKIGIADDHQLFRKSLMFLLKDCVDIEVVLEAADGIELLEQLTSQNIDVLLLDLQMPVMDGFQAAVEIQKNYPDIKILALTQLNEKDTVRHMIDIGVHGYFTKNADPGELEHAIRRLNEDGFYFERNLAELIDEVLTIRQDKVINEPLASFTRRELEVLRLTIQEYNETTIADILQISYKTVTKHKKNLMVKTRSRNFIGVIIYAIKNKIVDLNTGNM